MKMKQKFVLKISSSSNKEEVKKEVISSQFGLWSLKMLS
jgi:ribosomal protein L23